MEYKLTNPASLDLMLLSKELEAELNRGVAMSVVGNILYVHNSETEEKIIVKVIDDHLSSEAKELRQAITNNKLADLMRSKAYREESDSLFFKAQAGEIDIAEWKVKREEIKRRFPKEDVKLKKVRRKRGSVESKID